MVYKFTATDPVGFKSMPEGLDGYWWESDIVCVPLVTALQRGKFLPWLRSLESIGKPVFFPAIINARLEQLLRYRGYVEATTHDEQADEFVTGLLKQ